MKAINNNMWQSKKASKRNQRGERLAWQSVMAEAFSA